MAPVDPLSTALTRIDDALARALGAPRLAGSPPHLASAVRHAVFPGGGRVRPLLTLAAARACGEDDPELALAGAAAVELVHCASLVHDDLPVFDDAALRRGRATVHVLFGEPVALLAGDALIVHAFEAIAEEGDRHPRRALAMTRALVDGLGMPGGIIGGQAWECEPRIDRRAYQRAKTGALFRAALQLGALAAGSPAEPWAPVGDHLGLAYQIADDLQDLLGAPGDKPVGQDLRHGRPNAARELGVEGAVAALRQELELAVAALPEPVDAEPMVRLLEAVGTRLLPAQALPVRATG